MKVFVNQMIIIHNNTNYFEKIISQFKLKFHHEKV